jgi:hypothetical protein
MDKKELRKWLVFAGLKEVILPRAENGVYRFINHTDQIQNYSERLNADAKHFVDVPGGYSVWFEYRSK